MVTFVKVYLSNDISCLNRMSPPPPPFCDLCSHRRGSEVTYPLIVDAVHPVNLGTVYIHHPQTAVVVEQVEHLADAIVDEPLALAPEQNVLRKRIVNFSHMATAATGRTATATATIVPDVVRSSRTDSTTPAGVDGLDGGREMNAMSADVATAGCKPLHRAEDSSDDTDDDGTESRAGQLDSSTNATSAQFTEGTTSATEWIGITTNSEEENSYTSELDASDSRNECSDYAGDCDFAPTVILNPCCGINDRSESQSRHISFGDGG